MTRARHGVVGRRRSWRAAPGRVVARATRPGELADDSYRFSAASAATWPSTSRARPGACASRGRRRRARAGTRRSSASAWTPAPSAAPWVELSAGALRVRRSTSIPRRSGLRWLNLTRPAGRAQGRARRSRSRCTALTLDAGAATLRVFANRLDLARPILILAPHPDDAEIAAFGLYAGTQRDDRDRHLGQRGRRQLRRRLPRPRRSSTCFKGYLRAVDSVTVPWQGGIPPERCYNLGYFDARLSTDAREARRGRRRAVRPEQRRGSLPARERRAACCRTAPRTNTWANLVDDLAAGPQEGQARDRGDARTRSSTPTPTTSSRRWRR